MSKLTCSPGELNFPHAPLYTHKLVRSSCGVASKNVRSSSNIVESPASSTEALMQLNGSISAFCDFVMVTTSAMTEVTDNSQRGGEGKESVIETHDGLKDFWVVSTV